MAQSIVMKEKQWRIVGSKVRFLFQVKKQRDGQLSRHRNPPQISNNGGLLLNSNLEDSQTPSDCSSLSILKLQSLPQDPLTPKI